MKSESGIGDWLFSIGMMALIGGYLAYENLDAVTGWLNSMQPVQAAVQTSDGSMLTWAIDHWGAVLLVVGIVVFVGKMIKSRQATTEDGISIDYTSPAWIDVKMIE